MSGKLTLSLPAVAVMALMIAAAPAIARPRPAAAAPASDGGGWTMAAVNPSPYEKAPWWMNNSVITQTGFVYTEVPANRAQFSAEFQTSADTVEKAQAKAIDRTRALNQALDRLGRDAVRVTTSFSMRALYEEYRDKNGNRIEDQRGDKINGYEVSVNLALEVRDMSVLERAYALVLAASPTTTQQIYFSLQPDNATNTWLYSEAIKDAHTRAANAATAAGARLGAIQAIDPSGRACATDILARGADTSADYGDAQEVQYRSYDASPPPPPPPAPMAMAAPAPGTAEYLEAQAMKNPFIQTPPLQKLTATACVVYGLE